MTGEDSEMREPGSTESTSGTSDVGDAVEGTAAAEPEAADTAQTVADRGDGVTDGPRSEKKEGRELRLSISLRSLAFGALVATLVGALGVLGWLYAGARHELEAQARKSEHYARAEKVASDYAVQAAEMNFKDIDAWKAKLVEGTSPELKAKLTDAAEQMEQILVPLQWTSTARPLAAKVRSETGGIYTVDSFVSVLTQTVQSKDQPLQSTATYSIVIDGNHDWQITDVGGIGAALEQK